MLETRHLTKRYGALTAIRDVSFRAQPGEVLGLLGPNGSGKSTTVKILTGLLRPSSGAVCLDERDALEEASGVQGRHRLRPRGALVCDRRDAMVLGPMPVSARTIVSAKLGALAVLALGASGAISLMTAVPYALATAEDASARGLVWHFSAHLTATLFAARPAHADRGERCGGTGLRCRGADANQRARVADSTEDGGPVGAARDGVLDDDRLRASFFVPAELPASWTFRSHAPEGGQGYWSAVRSAMVAYVVPRTSLVVLLLVPVLGWRVSMFHAVYTFGLTIVLVELVALTITHVPFTQPYEPGYAKLQTRWPLYALAFWAFAYWPVRLELRRIGNIRWLVGALVFMAALVAAAEILGRYRASHRSAEPPDTAGPEFESVTTLALGAPS